MKSVVITGSTRGIGLCMAKEFLKVGCNITISGRSETMPQETKNEIDAYKDKTQYVPCDVQNKIELESLWEQAISKWGRVDIWINNAGQNCPYLPCFETEKKYVDAVIDTNIKGIIFGSQIAAKNMLLQGSGAIWNMEGLGSNNMIQAKTILYGTTKHALTYFTKGLAKELKGTNVTAGRLSPGMMLTDFITKTGDGTKPAIQTNESFKKIFNLFGDKPETVAMFFIPRILKNTKNNAQIIWLTNLKSMRRFMSIPFTKRKLF
ncbi:MAG: SDR family oxidoreductase [Vallitaleaceae bacterium]|nr:SDR family oxidoreductase [Vallitaleaceae bacterium]